MTQSHIIYEQPINELVRVCLRLEHLFTQLDLHMSNDLTRYTRDVVRIIVEILNVLDRPDLKSKLTQEFHRLITVFSRLHDSPKISKSKLKSTLDELQALLHFLVSLHGKIAQNLRENEFIANIRVHLLTPGGDGCFELPAYHYWLEQPLDTRRDLLNEWILEFNHIRKAIALLLSIIRTSADSTSAIAEKGFFHSALNTQPPGQLVCVSLANKCALYPEISVGKHRLNIRFYIPTTTERPKQTQEDIPFELMVCYI